MTETQLCPEDLLDSEQAGQYIGGVSIATMARYRSKGLGPKFIRVGGRRIRYRVRDLEEFLESRTVTPGGESVEP